MSDQKNSKRAPDPRPARTRLAILEAVDHLGASGAEVNVSSVVAEAGLSRSSFYSQFKDIGDIAVQLVRELEAEVSRTNTELLAQGESPNCHPDSLETFLTHFMDHRNIYNAVLGSGANVSAQWQACEIIAEGVAKRIASHLPTEANLDISAKYLAAGLIATVLDWIRAEDPLSVSQFRDQLAIMLPSWMLSGS